MADLDDASRATLRYLASFAPGTYHHVGDWPAGRTAGLVAMATSGLVIRRAQSKQKRHPSDYWTITDAGRAAYAANPLPEIPRRRIHRT